MSTDAPPVLPLTPIGDVGWRDRVRVRGRVRSLRLRPWGDAPTLEAVVVDGTGGLTLVFLSRRHLGGVVLGARLEAEGVVVEHQRRLVLINPAYTLLPGAVGGG